MEPIERVRLRARDGDSEIEREDLLAVEEPLEIRVESQGRGPARTFVTTMRTPGRDEDLAAGLLFAEGVLESPADIVAICRPDERRLEADLRGNTLVARLSPEAFARAEKLSRATVMGSACGVCGRTSIDRVLPEGRPPLPSELRIPKELLWELPGRLAQRQSVFSATGGLHAAALFDPEGSLLDLAEDVGRHNATDKLIGGFLRRSEVPLSGAVLLVSGRAGFEIVQKAFGAGIPILAAVSAPSSLAVALAEAGGLTLVGFLRGRRFNVYTHPRRIV